MNHICSFCGDAFEQGHLLGAHKRVCKQHPRFEEIQAHRKKSQTHERKCYQLWCVKCDSQYSLMLTETTYASGTYRKHCTQKCANSHQVSLEHRIKTSKALKGRTYAAPRQRKCVICETVFPCQGKNVTCSPTCKNKLLSQKLKGKTGGYRTKSGTSKFHGSWYRGVWMDSSWELALAQRLDAINEPWERGTKTLPYIDEEGQKHNYYPDFWLPNQKFFIEVKGYWLQKVRHKIADATARNAVKIHVLETLEAIQSYTPSSQ